MNERIFKLAKQADLIQWDTLPSGARTPDHESVVKARKFAELLIRECMDVVRDINQEYDGGSTVVNAANEIRNYFDVE